MKLSTLCKYCKGVSGLSCIHGVSQWEHVAQCLLKEGFEWPVGYSAKRFGLLHEAHISGGAKLATKAKVTDTKARVDFYSSPQWRALRMKVLVRWGARCQCCGVTPNDGAVMHVDHIKPRARHPELALDEENMQVLCEDCNMGKGAWDMTDWRPKEAPP